MTGDININILNESIQDIGNLYMDMLGQNNFIPCIKQPTRWNPQTIFFSCIDHFNFRTLKPSELELIRTAVIRTEVTDHYSTIATLNLTDGKYICDSNNTNTFNVLNYVKLEEILQNEPWVSVLSCNDVNESSNIFLNKFKHAIACSTESNKKSCKNKPIKEWMTPKLVLSIRNRDKQVLNIPIMKD